MKKRIENIAGQKYVNLTLKEVKSLLNIVREAA